MTERILGPTGGRQRRLWLIGPIATLVVLVGLFVSSSAVAVTPCTTANVLTGSNFEIDVDANLKVDGTSQDCIDWNNSGNNTQRSGVLSKNDKPAGSGDDSFGQGTAEDEANPTIVDGSIPPNKSDLKTFGVYTETTGGAQFLELFWSRIQNPSGTTNMDFELNQEFCDGTATHCANNAPQNKPPVYVTPKRTAGDKLITYDLSKGGTVPTISIRTWSGSAWGSATVISGPSGTAIGSVNSSAIASADSFIGAQDAFTFGEAALSYSAIFPGGTSGCGTFGSAYLKSRSSDSFPAELKDFIAPEPVQITNCSNLTTSATVSVTIGSAISDDAILTGATGGAGGTITFHLFSDATCTTEVSTGLSPVSVSGNDTYNSGNFTPTAVGTYYWTAIYSGDLNNAGSSTVCGDPGESSVVNKASPTLPTTPTAGGTVGLVTLNDSATVTGGYNPTGSILFELWDPDQPSCTGTPRYSQSVPLSGGSASTSPGFLADKAGTWNWTASYAGDANNNSASSGCGVEAVVVAKATPTLPTTPSAGGDVGVTLNDSATVTGGYNPTGSILFELWDPDQPSCTGTPRYSQSVPLSGGSASTSPGFLTDKAGTWNWTASYGGDSNNESASSGCGAEAVTISLIPSTISTAQTWYPQDTTTIGGGGGGTVDFALYKNSSDCTGSTVYTEDDVAVTGGTASTSNSTFAVSSVAALGDAYYWKASYSGDSSHKPVSSCVESTVFTSLDNGGTVSSG